MQLDSVGDVHATPDTVELPVAHDRNVGARAEGRREGRRDAALERIAGDVDELGLDALERLSLTLPDLDVKQLQQVAVPVGRRSSGALGTVEESVRYVKSNGARAERCTCGGVRRAHAGGIDERGSVSGESSCVPRRVSRVRAEQGNGR